MNETPMVGGLLSSPVAQGLLAGIGSAMAGRGSTTNALGQGLLGGLMGYQGAQDNARQAVIQNSLLAKAQSELEQRQRVQEQAQGRKAWVTQNQGGTPVSPLQALSAGGGPTRANASRIGQPQQLTPDQIYQSAVASGYFTPDEARDFARGNREEVKEYTAARMPDGSIQQVGLGKYGGTSNTGVNKPAEMKVAPNGQVYDAYSVKPGTVFNDVNQPFVQDPQGNIVANTPYQRYQLEKTRAGASRTNVQVDTAPKAFWGDYGKQASDSLFKEREVAQAASSTLQGIGEIRQSVSNGSFQGAGADLKLASARALSALGMNIASDQIKNSEQFNAIANSFVLNSIKTLGANPSNADRDFIEKTVPRLSTDPSALPLLLDYMEGKAKQQVDGFNNKIRGVQRQAGASFMPYSLEVPLPALTAANPTKPNSPAGGAWEIKKVN